MYPVLRLGSVGPDVARLQAILTAAGYPLDCDARFGPATFKAVTAFQAAHGLAHDGVWGAKSWAAAGTDPDPGRPILRGIDISSHQPPGSVDWPLMGQRYGFTILRATLGTSGVDQAFEAHRTGSMQAGLVTAAYHVLHGAQDAARQAAHAVEVADGLPIACDAELLDASPAVVAACMLAFCREVTDSTGRLPILYSYPSFLEGLPLDPEMADYPLWIAHYKVTKPRVPRPWKDWLLWQYDGDGGERLPSGVDADFNCYRGTKEQLRQVLGIAG